MLKGFFGRKEEEAAPDASRERQIVIEGQTEEVQQAMSLLAKEGRANLDQTMEDIQTAVQQAAKISLRDIRMMEEGRCPSCGHKTHQFLFTSVCANCGWFSYISPEEGKSIIHLKNGSTIECGSTFDTKGDYILGITDDVVRAKVSKDNVEHIQFVWTEDEIRRKRLLRDREQEGLCSWCEKPLTEAEDEPIITYAAFGHYQERYLFCSEKCEKAFQKQYPVRVHKNCYNRSCVDCDLCHKRYTGEDETYLKRLQEGKVT